MLFSYLDQLRAIAIRKGVAFDRHLFEAAGIGPDVFYRWTVIGREPSREPAQRLFSHLERLPDAIPQRSPRSRYFKSDPTPQSRAALKSGARRQTRHSRGTGREVGDGPKAAHGL